MFYKIWYVWLTSLIKLVVVFSCSLKKTEYVWCTIDKQFFYNFYIFLVPIFYIKKILRNYQKNWEFFCIFLFFCNILKIFFRFYHLVKLYVKIRSATKCNLLFAFFWKIIEVDIGCIWKCFLRCCNLRCWWAKLLIILSFLISYQVILFLKCLQNHQLSISSYTLGRHCWMESVLLITGKFHP